MAKQPVRKSLPKAEVDRLKKSSEPSFLDKLFGNIKEAVTSETGQQLLSGLVSQAVSDQSYGGRTFLAGVAGAKARQDRERAKVLQAEKLKLEQEKAKQGKIKAAAAIIGAQASQTKAATDVGQYGLDVQKYRQQVAKTFDENPAVARGFVDYLKTQGVEGQPFLSRILPGDQMVEYAKKQVYENPELFNQYISLNQ